MGAAYVGSNSSAFASSASARAVANNWTIKVGDILVLAVASFDASNLNAPTVSDNGGVGIVWTQARLRRFGGTGNSLSVWYSSPMTATFSSGNLTVTVTPSLASFLTLALHGYSGISSLYSSGDAAGTSTSNQPNSSAPGDGSELLFGALAFGAATTISHGGTNIPAPTDRQQINGGTLEGIDTADVVLDKAHIATSPNFDFTSSSNIALTGILCVFRASFFYVRKDIQRVDYLPDFDYSAYEQVRHQPVPVTILAADAPTKVYSQWVDPRPDYDYRVYEQVRLQPQPVTFAPFPPAMRQDSQQLSYDVPDYNGQWWQQLRLQPTPITYMPLPPVLRQGNQQLSYVLPDYDYSTYEQLRKQPVAVTFLITPIAHSQQLSYELPNYNYQWWEQLRLQPISVNAPPTRQPAQQLRYTIPDYDYRVYEQVRTQPVPVTFLPVPPILRQDSQQLSYALPDYDYSTYEQVRHQPVPVSLVAVPPAPPPAHSQQLSYELPDYDYRAYEQFRTQPKPITYLPPPPLLNPQHSQYVAPLPSYDYRCYQQRQLWPVPPATTVYVSQQQGLSGVYGLVGAAGQTGDYRVQNDIAGYNVYIGVGAAPDLTGSPAAFSHTLPVSVPITPPGSGTETIYVLVRYQDHYGLESLNQQLTSFVIDSSGNLVLNPIPVPMKLLLTAQAGGVIQIRADYPTLHTDKSPADYWWVWIDTVPPNTSLAPTAVKPVGVGTALLWNVGAYTPGIYHVALVLHRSLDNSRSPEAAGVVFMPAAPAKPTAVPYFEEP